MTCLVGLIQDGQTYIGTDGYATTEDCERKPIICRKLFASDQYIVAFAGHIRTGQLLYPESGFEFPEDIYQIPNAMYLWLREFEVIGKDDTQMGHIQSNFLILTKHKIYEILMDLSISEIDSDSGYTATGSGSPFAMGSLYTTSLVEDEPLPPKVRLEIALNAAAEYIKSCGPPYSIYSYDEAIKDLSTEKKKPQKKKKGVSKTRTKKKAS